MKSVSTHHAYDKDANTTNTAERARLEEINHFMTKDSFERFKQTPEEKMKLANAIASYPNRNHKPIN